MDRARRAEPYSSATIWTREVAKNLAGHLARISNVHSCVDTSSPKSTQLPKFQHTRGAKRCLASPVKPRQVLVDPLLSGTEASDSSTSSSSGRREDCVDNQAGARASEPTKQREDTPAQQQHKSRHHHHLAPHNAMIREHDQQEVAAHDAKRTLDKVRGPGQARPKAGNALGDSTYDCPPAMSSGKFRPGMDYKQKQAQLKIWQENQALAKRLRSTKPTLKSKDWERDDKWNQEFLRSQERRRSLLQTELGKVHTAPHTTIVRVRPLKLPQHEPSAMVGGDDGQCQGRNSISGSTATTIDGSGLEPVSARRRRARSRTLGSEPLGETSTQLVRLSAVNHRRILQLRQQKNLNLTENEAIPSIGKDVSRLSTVDLNDDELVDIRFTFSQRRNNRTGRVRHNGEDEGVAREDADPPHDNVTDGKYDETKVDTLNGASSPGVELEEALDHLGDAEVSLVHVAADEEDSPRSSEGVSLTPASTDSQECQFNDAIVRVEHPLLDPTIDPIALAAAMPGSDAISCSVAPEEPPGGSENSSTCSSVGHEAAPVVEQSCTYQSDAALCVGGIPSHASDSSGSTCEESASAEASQTTAGSIEDGHNQTINGSDWALDSDAEGLLFANDKRQAATLPEAGGEAGAIPTVDEKGAAASEEQQTDGDSTVDASLLDAEPEYRDDVFDDDYQTEDERREGQLPGTGTNEGTSTTSASPEQAGEYDSDYDDNGELDEDGDGDKKSQAGETYSGEAACGERGQDDACNGELEYSQDGFADD